MIPANVDMRRILDDVVRSLVDADDDVICVREYSGRGMYGRLCLAIECPRGDYIDVIEAAASLGLYGAKVDQLGLGMIVYWPHPRIESRED